MSSLGSSQQDAPSVFRLPDFVWESIICRLRTHHRAKLRGACRKFRTLVNNTVKKVKLDPTHSEDALHWQLHSRFPSLEHVEVIKPSDVDCFTDQTFAQLALKDLSRLPGLTSLNLEHCTQLTVAGMAALALACPQVCQLCTSDVMLLALGRLPDLAKLRLQCCKHCDEVALAYLSDLKRLTALELEDYGQALRQVLNKIYEGKTALLNWVTGMTGLTHVDIQRVDVSGEELQRFTALTGLVHLGVGDLNLECSGRGGELDHPLPLLSVTKLVSHNILYEAHLRTTFPSLRALSCDSTDSSLKNIAEITSLVNLFLWDNPVDSISDVGLAGLSGLRRLETFRLEGSGAVTDSGWVDFTSAHSALTKIDLAKCPNITDIGFILSIRNLSRLERVSFTECPLIDTRTLAALLAFCPKLELLELQDCDSVSLASLRNLLSTASHPDLELVYRKGRSMRTMHCCR
ncbi:hypothetical protein VOLCADRAFT_121287 [Volvox carteri f. nagariensis]|uniref:F-box domain-containing protein n=1 Tax=Volvox carteri f. nagariensis TaxID=3068 RepID=D8U6K1_VOLCA|nr:uncharacterized protein VOLCADRAFT_121287 [Volvox carteri f. nagariensis]EFJ44728.1 hypothetical protein VOLCADRAFT_121287 [Volvox carteri f. nagariensis]|eukprot:XP_002954304.1 hypothetical protein VOLCADRAFT_121287 [Volvox carteri f. nagariensis]